MTARKNNTHTRQYPMISVVRANLPTVQRKLIKTSAATQILRQILSHRLKFASAISLGVSFLYFLNRTARDIK